MPKRSLKRRRSKRVRNSRRYLKKGGGNSFSQIVCNPSTIQEYIKKKRETQPEFNITAGQYCKHKSHNIYPLCGIDTTNPLDIDYTNYCFTDNLNETSRGRPHKPPRVR